MIRLISSRSSEALFRQSRVQRSVVALSWRNFASEPKRNDFSRFAPAEPVKENKHSVAAVGVVGKGTKVMSGAPSSVPVVVNIAASTKETAPPKQTRTKGTI